jgi:hypothetical protein
MAHRSAYTVDTKKRQRDPYTGLRPKKNWRYSSTVSITLALEGGGVASTTPRPLYLREIHAIHYRGGWVGARAGLDGCGKSRPHRDSTPGPSGPSLYRLHYPGPCGRCTSSRFEGPEGLTIVIYGLLRFSETSVGNYRTTWHHVSECLILLLDISLFQLYTKEFNLVHAVALFVYFNRSAKGNETSEIMMQH